MESPVPVVFDHFGGAKYLQDTYHTQIGLSEADWKTIETTPLSEGIMRNVPPPKRMKVLISPDLTTSPLSRACAKSAQ